MAGAPLEKTRTPGIFRRGSKYVVVYWVDGRQVRERPATGRPPHVDGPPSSTSAGASRSRSIGSTEPPPLGESLLNRLERTARIR